MNYQLSMFDGEQEFYNDKPIRLIELFGGYGSQSLSLKYLGVPFEHYRLSEWTVKSIQAYKDMHFADDNTDYSQGLTAEQIRKWLYGKISADYNTPMTEQQINRLSQDKLRTIYNNMQATHNLGSITQIKAEDLTIVDTDRYCYIMTYSFPCQDLSLAGKKEGMSKDSGTRSGLLWEVSRLLNELNNMGGQLPQVLLMENVPQVHGKKNKDDFQSWIDELERLGYKNYWQDLNAKDFGIPQNRNRCFMISLLGDYNFSFPKSQNLTVRLKDFLDKKVDDKYYLSNKTIEMFVEQTRKQKEKGNGFKFEPTDGNCVSHAILTKAGERKDDNFIVEKQYKVIKPSHGFYKGECLDANIAPTIDTGIGCWHTLIGEETKCEQVGMLSGGKWDRLHEQSRRVYGVNGLAPTIHTCGGGNLEPKIVEPIEVELTYSSYVNEKYKKFINENGYIPDLFNPYNATELQNLAPTITAQGDSITKSGTVLKLDEFRMVEKNSNYISVDLPNCNVAGKDLTQYHIRKLTEKECFRLMGVKEEDFKKISKNQSMSSLYHLCGDSIVTTCLMAIFGKLLNIDYETKINKLVEKLIKEKNDL